MQQVFPRSLLTVLLAFVSAFLSPSQTAHTLAYGPGKAITLLLPPEFEINIAQSGLKRPRFFAQAPDGRIFLTTMYDLSDNRRGSVLILEGWDERRRIFTRVTRYLDHLRNPNNLAFWTDPGTKQSWVYVPLTDKLVRFKYNAGDNGPTSAPETLIQFPDYGLNYKYGGWHLTRTVTVARINGAPRIFVSIGSSCNYCREDEVLRAAIVSMDPDGTHQRIEAQGMRNAVDLHTVPEIDEGALFATNMGDDHLGDKLPEDTFFELNTSASASLNYGWPACYFAGGRPVLDTTKIPALDDARSAGLTARKPAAPKGADDSVYGKQVGLAAAGTNLAAGGGHSPVADANAATLGHAPAPLKSCAQVPAAYTTFAAHSSPLGFAYFGQENAVLAGSFLVALHGSSHPHIGTGYGVARFTQTDRKPRDFITGFLTIEHGKAMVHGRPCGVLPLGNDSFLLTDDYLGLIYYVHPRAR